MAGRIWLRRLIAIVAAGGFLAMALGIRKLAGGPDMLDSSGALAQCSGTALYASIIYAGVFALEPRIRPLTAAATAIAFCWLSELLQRTGLPAYLSERSLVARLVLGVQFDINDLAWYPVGIVPLAVLHHVVARHAQARSGKPDRADADVTVLTETGHHPHER